MAHTSMQGTGVKNTWAQHFVGHDRSSHKNSEILSKTIEKQLNSAKSNVAALKIKFHFPFTGTLDPPLFHLLWYFPKDPTFSASKLSISPCLQTQVKWGKLLFFSNSVKREDIFCSFIKIFCLILTCSDLLMLESYFFFKNCSFSRYNEISWCSREEGNKIYGESDSNPIKISQFQRRKTMLLLQICFLIKSLSIFFVFQLKCKESRVLQRCFLPGFSLRINKKLRTRNRVKQRI